MFENLILERDGAIALVTVNRPHVLNALNIQTLDELRRAMIELKDDGATRAVILTGAGEKAFVAGADISELAALSPVAMHEHATRGQQVFDAIENLGKPVIAAINGFALGGGCELAMACTVRIAADSARLGQPEINLGLLPGFAGTQRLPRLVGKGVALEMLLTGRHVTADEALRIGLVTRVFPEGDFTRDWRAYAQRLASGATEAFALTKRGLNASWERDLGPFLDLEAELQDRAGGTHDYAEGVRAFREKRPPKFEGR